MPANENFRDNLRLAMDAKGISQRRLAELSECSYPYVNRVLQGHVEPSLPQCEKLAKAVGYPLGSLIEATSTFRDYVSPKSCPSVETTVLFGACKK